MQATELRDFAIEQLQDMKAKELVALDVSGMTSLMDTMIICSGTSSRHVSATAEKLIQASKQQGITIFGREADALSQWVLIDLGDVVVHIMQPETRAFYQLEKLWAA